MFTISIQAPGSNRIDWIKGKSKNGYSFAFCRNSDCPFQYSEFEITKVAVELRRRHPNDIITIHTV